jgi:hypothetical protein
MKWACGMISVPQRLHLAELTAASIRKAGFQLDLVRVDQHQDAFANFFLTLHEVYLREPKVDAYAMFEDDIVICRGVREYIEKSNAFAPRRYLNLFAFRRNEGHERGWTEGALCGAKPPADPTLQAGEGALALVWSNEGIRVLLSSRPMHDHSHHLFLSKCCQDGAVVNAMNLAGYREYVHTPSLVQHTGDETCIPKSGKPPDWRWGEYGLAKSFPGEDFDALSLL